jgi:hypothetical protein
MVQGLVLFARSIGNTSSIIFLKFPSGVVVTLPPKWKMPPLLKGMAVEPSNCSNLTELFPKMSKTKPRESFALSSTIADIVFTLSVVGVQPGTLTSSKTISLSTKNCFACFMLLAPTRVTFWLKFSDDVFFSAVLARYISGREQARKLAKAQLSRQPSNSLHLSFDNL